MKIWKTCYEYHKEKVIWKHVKKAVRDLIDNKDIKINTHPDYVIGYLVENLSKKFRFVKK